MIPQLGFEAAFEAEGGYFIRNAEGFLLALVPVSDHRTLPQGFHVGFGLHDPATVHFMHETLTEAGVETSEADDAEDDYITFL